MLRAASSTRPKSIDDLLSPEFVAKLSRVDLASRKVFAGKLKGERRSKRRGESVEFADHRPYVVGDDLRFIDWNIYGRLDKLFLKMFMEEEDLSLHIVIDASASSDCGEPSKFRYMQEVAAALGYIGLVNYNRVTLTAVGGVGADPNRAHEEAAPSAQTGETPVPPVNDNSGVVSTLRNLRGRRRVHDMGAWLCGLEPAGATNFTEGAKRIALSRTGKGVMVVLSDFFFKEGYEQGMRYLLGRGYDVFAMQVLSPQEVTPEIGGDLRLKDVEDADLAEVTISKPLLDQYKKNLTAYCDQLRQFCARRDILHLLVQTDEDIETLVLDVLRRRGLLR
jgi:uncharacterized protein (DUF58 family)